jgi:hypothetical protein
VPNHNNQVVANNLNGAIDEELDKEIDEETAGKVLREQLLADAVASQKKYASENKVSDALLFLQLQDIIDLKSPEIVAMQSSEVEKNTQLNHYIANPLRKDGEQPLQFMEGLEKLDKTITLDDAEKFQAWSDTYSDTNVALTKLLDENLQVNSKESNCLQEQ